MYRGRGQTVVRGRGGRGRGVSRGRGRGGRGRGGRGGRGRGGASKAWALSWTPAEAIYTDAPFGLGSASTFMDEDKVSAEKQVSAESEHKGLTPAMEKALYITKAAAKRKPASTPSTTSTKTPKTEASAMEKKRDSQEEDEDEAIPIARTENNDVAFATTGNALVDFFFGGMLRGADEPKVHRLLSAAWSLDAKLAVQILLHGRDCRGGKGEKECVLSGLLWLRTHKPLTYVLNLRNFLERGYHKDLLVLATRATTLGLHRLGSRELIELEILSEDLQKDYDKLKKWKEDKQTETEQQQPEGTEVVSNDEEKKEVKKTRGLELTLAAKWAPTENGAFDKKAKLVSRLAALLFPSSESAKKEYRLMISEMRQRLRIVERFMCLNQWEKIKFSAVPSKSHKLHKKAFQEHQPERYTAYLEKLTAGKEKVNVAGLHPHEVLSKYYKGEAEDPLVEAQWKTIVDKLRPNVHLTRALSMCDVSGSMSGTPMEVCIALGLITAELAPPPFHNKVITFSTDPQFHEIPAGSAHTKLQSLSRASWSMSTDLDKAFALILTTAQQFQVPAEEMPDTLFIYSDMQFNSAVRNADSSLFARARADYAAAGYPMPKVVFWNLRGDTQTFPTTNEAGVALVSGFSADLLKVFMDDADFTPLAVLKRAVSKYEATIDPSEV